MKQLIGTLICVLLTVLAGAQTNYALTPLPDTVINGKKFYVETVTEVNDAGETIEGTELIDSTEYIRRVYRDASNANAQARLVYENLTLVGNLQRAFTVGNTILQNETGRNFFALQNERAPGTLDHYPEFEGTWRVVADSVDFWVRADLGSGLAREIDPVTNNLVPGGKRIRFLPLNAGYARVTDVSLTGEKINGGVFFPIVRRGGERFYRQVQTRDLNGIQQIRVLYVYVEPFSGWSLVKFDDWVNI